MPSLVPIPKTDVSVREATLADVAFIDSLQKRHSDRVGFLKTVALEGKIRAGEILVAEDGALSTSSGQAGALVGYIIGVDRYNKREDVGIIYQLNVAPGRQRGFVGATLLKAMFDRAAYGCRLFCCWCAQDIEANHFWQAMGFVPLAYRAGSEKKARVHIFWQKRIREGDVETPWWYPSKTGAGMLGEGRLVLPIPPGRRWCDEMPVMVLPGEEAPPAVSAVERKQITDAAAPRPRKAASKALPQVVQSRRLSFAPVVPVVAKEEKKPRACPERSRGEKKPKRKNDPKLVAAARELRDRWLEQVNAGAYVFEDAGKYDVSRALPAAPAKPAPAFGCNPTRMLPAA